MFTLLLIEGGSFMYSPPPEKLALSDFKVKFLLILKMAIFKLVLQEVDIPLLFMKTCL